MARHMPGVGTVRALIDHDAHDFGDDIPAFFDDDEIIYADVFASHFVFIMKRSAGDGAAGKQDGIELCHRCKNACAPYLHDDIAHTCGRLLGCKFISYSPARAFARHPKLVLQAYLIEFHYDSINLIGQCRSCLFHLIGKAI